MDMKTLHIGIAPPSYVRKRMLAIARGEKRLPGEPSVWVSSLESLARVLTEKNMLLLEMIRNSQPQSLSELARISERALPNLSRTLPFHGEARHGRIPGAAKRAKGANSALL